MYNFAVNPERIRKNILRSTQYVSMLGEEQGNRSPGLRSMIDIRDSEEAKISSSPKKPNKGGLSPRPVTAASHISTNGTHGL